MGTASTQVSPRIKIVMPTRRIRGRDCPVAHGDDGPREGRLFGKAVSLAGGRRSYGPGFVVHRVDLGPGFVGGRS